MNFAYWFQRRRLIKRYGERRVVIAELRSHLHAFGHDTSHLTDDQIEQGALEFRTVMASIGVSANQASESLKAMTRAAS